MNWIRAGRHAFVACTLLLSALTGGSCLAQVHQRGEFQFSVSVPQAWVIERTPAEAWDPTAPGASGAQWRHWLVDSQSDRRAGMRARYTDRVYEPVSSEMTREAGKVQIWFNPEFQQLTIHRVAIRRNGKWLDRLVPEAVTLARRESQFERDMSTGTVSALFVMNDVQVGDLVRVSYTIVGHNPIMAGLDNEEFSFAWTDPILDRSARVLFDADARLAVHRDSRTPQPRETRSEEFVEFKANANASAAIIDEGSYPRWYAVTPSIVVSEQRDWSAVVDWVVKLYPPAAPLPADLERRIGEWRAMPDDGARIAAVLRAVQEEVRYFGIELGDNTHKPAEPADTWSRRYGDCKDKARLLATVLGHLGIKANPALVSTTNGRRVADLPASAAAFDHVIVQVHVGTSILWLDPTQTQQRGAPSAILPADHGVALPVVAGARGLVDVISPSGALDHTRIVERFEPAADDTVAFRVESEYRGAAADLIRLQLEFNGLDAIARRYAEFYRRRYGEVAVVEPVTVRDDETQNRLTMIEHYTLAKPWLGATPALRNRETYADPVARVMELPRTSSRIAPYARHHPVTIEHLSELKLPADWRWNGSAQTREFKDAAMEFKFNARQVDDVVRIERSFRSLADVVEEPAFADHFHLLRAAGDFVGWRILASPPAAEAASEREQRLKRLMRSIIDDNAARDSKSRRN